MISAGQVDAVLALIRKKFPNWQSFTDEDFVSAEVEYKRAAAAKARELLGRDALQSLIDKGDFDEIIARLKAISAATNLLYLSVPRAGDNAVIAREEVDRPAVCRAIFDLLHGSATVEDRLDAFLASVGAPDRKWTFPTYLLFLCHPDSELYVRPTVMRRFLRVIGLEDAYAKRPSGRAYHALKQIVGQLRDAMRAYGPRDMIDMQSVVWVCARASEEATAAKRPLAQFLADEVPPERLNRREAAEREARALLEERAGRFIQKDFEQLFDLLNTDWHRGTLRRDRFGQALIGHNPGLLLASIDAANEWIAALWRSEPRTLIDVLDRVWRDRPLKGAGRFLPSAILYLRDPERFACWSSSFREGLETLSGEPLPTRKRGQHYLDYCEAVARFREMYQIPARAIDVVLSKAGEITIPARPDALFSARTFELLSELHQNPTKVFYTAHQAEIRVAVEDPLKDLFEAVAAKLPAAITDLMETKKGILARIPKNDYGQGGAWDYYWGAFYPKGGKRISHPQLFVWLNRDRFDFGFYVGEYGAEHRARFKRNSRLYADPLAGILGNTLNDAGLQFGARSDSATAFRFKAWQEWLANADSADVRAGIMLSRNEVLAQSAESLTARIAETFQRLFPLVLLATDDDPLPAISRYLGIDEEAAETQPEYTLDQCAAETNIPRDVLERWARAIDRKGQAIFYGPPGTGKTFVAERLARHLIRGRAGFKELVQFHPAYAYEDFMQGIRPRANADGGLDYPTVPGRFLDFCTRAARTGDPCVLIVDEINRANLARVFGELMYLFEYRDQEIPLASGGRFRIPPNVRILGTMNTADRSIALVDHALRRRFAFIPLYPDYAVLQRFHAGNGFPVEKLIGILQQLNGVIGDRNYQVGISFFLASSLTTQIEDIWRMEIEPYLEEYFFDQASKVDPFRWESVRAKILP